MIFRYLNLSQMCAQDVGEESGGVWSLRGKLYTLNGCAS